MNRIFVLLVAVAMAGCRPANQAVAPTHSSRISEQTYSNETTNKVVKTEEEWKKELTPEQYRVLRQKDTERPFTGKYLNTHEAGVYRCAACGYVLFSSDTKFDSGCGWPSFYAPASTNAVAMHEDRSFGMNRTEVNCPRCGGHLGHVFDDGPKPTGLRYCINSASLQFEPKNEK